jgi:hypothetical protein
MNIISVEIFHIIILIGVFILGLLVNFRYKMSIKKMDTLNSKLEQLEFKLSNINSTVNSIYESTYKEEQENMIHNYGGTEYDSEHDF